MWNFVGQGQQDHCDDKQHAHFFELDAFVHPVVVVVKKQLTDPYQKHHDHELGSNTEYGFVVVDRHVRSPSRTTETKEEDAAVGEYPTRNQ